MRFARDALGSMLGALASTTAVLVMACSSSNDGMPGTSGTSATGTTTATGAGTGGAAGASGVTTGGSSDAGAAGSGAGGSGGSSTDGGTGTIAGGVRWIGRVDISDPSKPRFGWSGTGFVARFTGTSIGVTLNNDDAYFFQPVIDGKTGTRYQATKGMATHTIATGLAAGTHTLELYRESEASYGVSQFLAITEANLMAPPPAPARFIEFVGDSITAGYGNLGAETHPNYTDPVPCHYTYDTQSAYQSFGAVAARALGAEASLIAASGWGVYRSLSGSMNEVLPKVYANTLGYTPPPTWSFAPKPDVVVINLGTNDFGMGDPGMPYATALGAFVDTVRSKYPNAWIFCALGTMLGNPSHDQASAYINSVVQAHRSDAGKVAFVDFGIQDALKGTGCDWHPNTAEDQRMANLLVPAIKQKLGW